MLACSDRKNQPVQSSLTHSHARRELIALDDALNALAVSDTRRAKVVELRFFGGLTVEETAEVIGVSPDTVMRGWGIARAWLRSELKR
jgi:RNA polymerase sigma-70 factor (ECF subfamily)